MTVRLDGSWDRHAVPDLSCFDKRDQQAAVPFIAGEASLLYFLAQHCDARILLSLTPAERTKWRALHDQCLHALGLRRVGGRRGAPPKTLSPTISWLLKQRYEQLRERLRKLKGAAARRGGVTAAFSLACDGWTPGPKIEGLVLLDAQRRYPTWRPLREALGAWVGISEAEFRRRIAERSERAIQPTTGSLASRRARIRRQVDARANNHGHIVPPE